MNIEFKTDYDFNDYPIRLRQKLISYKWTVAGRLSPIYENINKEEAENLCMIVIHYSDINDKFETGYTGYSKELTKKIKELLNEQFGIFIASIFHLF